MIPSNSKQQQLTFDQGVTNVPSDAVCSDNTLEESLGLVYKNGEHQVIQDPVLFMSGMHAPMPDDDNKYDSYKLLYVHRQNDQERYIVQTDNGEIVWGTREDGVCYAVPNAEEEGTYKWSEPQDNCLKVFDDDNVQYDNPDHTIFTDILENILMTATGTPKVTSVGKTLVVSDEKGIHTFIWKEKGYSGEINIPIPQVTFWLDGMTEDGFRMVGSSQKVDANGSVIGWNEGHTQYAIYSNKQDYWNDVVLGIYAKNKVKIAQKKGFCLPFYARVALELFDGTYAFMSNPILMFPSVSMNTVCGTALKWGGIDDPTAAEWRLTIKTIYSHLFCTQITDYSGYKDIIKDVVIFISDGIEINDTLVDQVFLIQGSNTKVLDAILRENRQDGYYVTRTPAILGGTICRLFEKRDPKDIEGDLTSVSAFYKLCSIGTAPVRSFNTKGEIGIHTLENLTTQEQITIDNYYSWNRLVPSFLQTYNSRLLMANVKRDFFKGYSDFITYTYGETKTFRAKVTVATDEKDIEVWNEYKTDRIQGIYFFYPDTRAKHVVIYRNFSKDTARVIVDTDLKEHASWNGSYYFYGMDFVNSQERSDTAPWAEKCPTNDDYEQLGNYVIQSEVSNPWVFPPSGYHKISTGKITGMSSNVQALSQGQFGQHPLLVFSETGIWAMTTNATGLFSSIHPMSREVCINPASITQTDNQVFFVGEKGLMATTEANVAAVSQQLMGRNESDTLPFALFSRACITAYDSRDALLWLFGEGNTCFVYSLTSGAFATKKLTQQVTNTVNNYPDFLLQTGDAVYSLLARPDINEDDTTYAARLITRPMKLENALAMKSIMQVRHIADMEGTMTLRVFASNNLTSWAELHSLRGMPWKYYRFRYDFTGLKATDRFAGTVVVTQDRRANKMR